MTEHLERARALLAQEQVCHHVWEPLSADAETYEVRCEKCGMTQRRRFDADVKVVPEGVPITGSAGDVK